MNLLKKGIKAILAGEELEDKQLADFRLNVCQSNAGDCYDAEADQCKECGCFMEIKTQLLTNRNPRNNFGWEFTHCPLGKWNDSHVQQINKLLT